MWCIIGILFWCGDDGVGVFMEWWRWERLGIWLGGEGRVCVGYGGIGFGKCWRMCRGWSGGIGGVVVNVRWSGGVVKGKFSLWGWSRGRGEVLDDGGGKSKCGRGGYE